MVKGRRVSSSRVARRVFAKKTRPSIGMIMKNYVERGGGYL